MTSACRHARRPGRARRGGDRADALADRARDHRAQRRARRRSRSSGSTRRGVPLAQRLRRLIAERAGVELDLGQLDITFHRDDVARARRPAPRRAPADRPRHQARLRARRPHGHPRRRRPLHGPHDPRRDRRAASSTAARRASSSPCSPTAATASCRSGPTTSARTCRPHASERVQVQLLEVDEVDQVVLIDEREEGER